MQKLCSFFLSVALEVPAPSIAAAEKCAQQTLLTGSNLDEEGHGPPSTATRSSGAQADPLGEQSSSRQEAEQKLLMEKVRMLALLPFHGNSRPLHRQLLTAMNQLPAPWLEFFSAMIIGQVCIRDRRRDIPTATHPGLTIY
jgi:hypothetical protein